MSLTSRPDLASVLESKQAWLKGYLPALRVTERGTLVSVGDGIAWIDGLPSAGIEEIVACEDGSRALVFHLTSDLLGAILLRQTDKLTSGTAVHLTGQQLSIGVGDGLLGRVVDPLGVPLDGAGPPELHEHRALEALSPAIVERDFVSKPLYTGTKIIDTLIPIGKGQRQLLVGDEGLGRSALALDAVVSQRGRNVRCVYVLVGQRRSTVVSTIETLKRYGAMDYTTVVVGEASALPGLQYLAPFSGCAVAEEWMHGGWDTLVVYDDLSSHARAYRELSLLLRRPPGREAFPGDIFFLHARLLERATCLSAGLGGGSMTALPIVETQQGEIAAYIPTNLISITDGQIYLDRDLFAGGFRPAIDIAKSVSRIGGKAQHPRIKEEAGRMKLDYLQFLELEIFTRFGARLEASMEAKLKRGRLLREALKQDRLDPCAPAYDLAWLIAYNDGLLDRFSPSEIHGALVQLQARVAANVLDLDSDRQTWLAKLSQWLGAIEEDGK